MWHLILNLLSVFCVLGILQVSAKTKHLRFSWQHYDVLTWCSASISRWASGSCHSRCWSRCRDSPASSECPCICRQSIHYLLITFSISQKSPRVQSQGELFVLMIFLEFMQMSLELSQRLPAIIIFYILLRNTPPLYLAHLAWSSLDVSW